MTFRSAVRLFALIFALLFLIPITSASARTHHAAASPDDTGPTTPASVKKYLTGKYPHPHSRYVVLMDVNSGKILYEINPNAHREPASLTKIMAATILLEHGKLSDTVVAPAAVKGIPESSLHLRPGERISLEDLLYAMLLRSANDTPIAGAYYLCGSVPPFVAMMNAKAQALGCNNTRFVTPNGLYEPNHYSTARDLAVMARNAVMTLPVFNDIVKTQKYRVHRSIDKGDTLVVNTSLSFLKYFPGADGIKTGYIHQAGHCFVGSATRHGWRLIAVALDSSQCREDVMQMLSYGFAHFTSVVAVPQGTSVGRVKISGTDASVTAATERDLDNVLSNDHPPASPIQYTIKTVPLSANQITLPIKPGDTVGTVSLFADGKFVTNIAAVATEPLEAASILSTTHNVIGMLTKAGKIAATVMLTLLGMAVVALIALMIYGRALAKNSRRRRSRLAEDVRTVD